MEVRWMLRLLCLFAINLLLLCSTNGQAQESKYLSISQATADPTLDPEQTVGFQACLKCHAAEVGVWSQTWHQTSIKELHRSDEAKSIAQKLNLKSIKYSERCIKCHYTPVVEAGTVSISAAVSCECCHGAAGKWWNNHFPAQESVATETPEQRADRIVANLKNGMRNRHNTFTMARICMRCHNVTDEQLVNVGGHNLGGINFELVSWSQGLMRHRFISGGGDRNAPNPKERLAMMFVSGMIADLEFSLRATANATINAEFGRQVAKRAATAAKRIASVEEKTQLPILREILNEYQNVQLKTNNNGPLMAAAEKIRELGVRFGAEHDGSELLPALAEYLPRPKQWIFD